MTSTMLGCFRTQQKTREEVSQTPQPHIEHAADETVLDVDPDPQRCQTFLVSCPVYLLQLSISSSLVSSSFHHCITVQPWSKVTRPPRVRSCRYA